MGSRSHRSALPQAIFKKPSQRPGFSAADFHNKICH
jgi:hypothetical protein